MRVGVYNIKTKTLLKDRFSNEGFWVERAAEDPDKIFFLPECWENFFESVRYKEGWFFEYQYDIDYDTEIVYVGLRTPDRDDPNKMIVISPGYIRLPDWCGMDYAQDKLRHIIMDIEMHEMDEHIMVAGERVFDPHKQHFSIKEVTQ